MQEEISTKPYLLRALYEWCTDNGFTPHISVRVDSRTRVPRQFVRGGEIVLNISFGATSQLQMGNETIEFLARFSGKSHRIEIPVDNVQAIYARENSQGMAFPVDAGEGECRDSGDDASDTSDQAALQAPEPASEPGHDHDAASSTDGGDGADGKTGPDDGKGRKGHLRIVK